MKRDYSLLVLRSHVSRVYLVFTGGILFPAKNLFTDLVRIFLADPFSLVFVSRVRRTQLAATYVYIGRGGSQRVGKVSQ